MDAHPRDLLLNRLRQLQRSGARKLKVIADTRERILVEFNGDSYLIMIPGSGAELTPRRISDRVAKWRRLKGRNIKGHLLLSMESDLSAQVITADGSNLPDRVAVVGKWGSVNRLAASRLDAKMAYLLELCGLRRAEARRPLRRKLLADRAALVAASPSPDTLRPIPLPRSLRRGLRLDAYQLERRLGRGHSAEVWKATLVEPINGVDLDRGATVAIKIYLPSILQGFQPLRIQREFSVASDIAHENLARVYDLVLSPSRPFHTFMVMEYVDGPTLKAFTEQTGRLTLRQTVLVAAQMFAALEELHSVGAVHRDVKAANIMLAQHTAENFKIKLVDLGIVALASEDQFTQASLFLGSKHSAPLEQLTGEDLDERTDIYGAGSVLFHCIRGIPLYHNVGPEGAIVRKMLSSPEWLSFEANKLNLVERTLYEFVNRCIAVRPQDRPPTATECLASIAKLIRPESLAQKWSDEI